MLHSPFAATLLLPSLSVSIQPVDFGLPNGGRVSYLVLSKLRKASPFTLYASSHPTWITKPTTTLAGRLLYAATSREVRTTLDQDEAAELCRSFPHQHIEPHS